MGLPTARNRWSTPAVGVPLRGGYDVAVTLRFLEGGDPWQSKVPHHLRHMSADNEELHKAYEEGIEVAKSWLGRSTRSTSNGEGGPGSRLQTEHSPIDGDVPSASSRRAPARTSGRGRRGEGGVPRVGEPPVAGAGRDHAQGRRPDHRASQRARGAHGDGGRQEPARGARRRRGDGRPDPLLRQGDGGARRLRARRCGDRLAAASTTT